MLKRILIVGVIIGLMIVLISFLPDAAAYVISWFLPPKMYYLIGFAIIIVLLKILYELRKRNDRDDEK